MHILVLDSIHGGKVIADHLSTCGHEADLVDVYRHADTRLTRSVNASYDLIVAPVHLDPDYPVFHEMKTPVISHHAAVRWLLGEIHANPVIEITGKQGKSTTAAALASIMPGPGLLHTSSGLVRYPEKEVLGRFSITPASLLSIQRFLPEGGWLIAEVSLGFCGIGTLGILTSFLDYPVANGKRSALTVKIEHSHQVRQVLIPPDGTLNHVGAVCASALVSVTGTQLSYTYRDVNGSFMNHLLILPGYKTPLMLAAAAALLLGIDPAELANFSALSGRMEVRREGNYIIIDNANSGTCRATTLDAWRYGRELAGTNNITLVIGQEAASVCENFSTDEICSSISEIHPSHVILIAGDERIMSEKIIQYCTEGGIICLLSDSSEDGIRVAKSLNNPLIIVSVKRWK